jgi:hypothetical protein
MALGIKNVSTALPLLSKVGSIFLLLILNAFVRSYLIVSSKSISQG